MFRVITPSPINLAGKFLVLPAISVGSSGTLALDLFLNSHPFSKIGWIYTSDFLPIVGLHALDAQVDSLTMPLELFECSNQIFLQIRSLCTDKKGFTDRLVSWALESGISQIIVAGSNWDEMKANEEEAEVFYMTNALSTTSFEMCKKDYKEDKDFLTGAGIADCMLKQERISTSIIMVYGRDIPADVQSAYRLVEGLATACNIPTQATPPRSWQSILN